MKTEVPLFGAAVSEGVSAFVKAMNMSLDDEMENFTQEEIANAMTAVSLLKATIQSTEDSMVGFRNVFVQLPRLTSVLNKAKRNVATVLDTLVIEFQTAQNLTNEAEAVIKRAASEHAKKDGR
jgi:hypothetical protein